jgi:hypothetical protein
MGLWKAALVLAAFVLLAGCSTQYKDCCQRAYAVNVIDGTNFAGGGNCVLLNGTNISHQSISISTVCQNETGPDWVNACNVTYPGSNPPKSELIPVCTDSIPSICVQENCTAMICGKWRYDQTPSANRQDVEGAAASAGSQSLETRARNSATEGLYQAVCKFEPLTRRTANTIKRAKGALWLNAFRFGIGDSFGEFERYRTLFPTSDAICASEPQDPDHPKVDRYMNYYTFTPSNWCGQTNPPVTYWTCTGAGSGNYTSQALCLLDCWPNSANPTGACGSAVWNGYAYICPAAGQYYNSNILCKSLCPRFNADVCPNTAFSATALPFLNPATAYYKIADTVYRSGIDCQRPDPGHCNWYWDGGNGITYEDSGATTYSNTPPENTFEGVSNLDYEKVLRAQYQNEMLDGTLLPNGNRKAGAPFECEVSQDCLSGYCNKDTYSRYACLNASDTPNFIKEIDCGCYPDETENVVKCTGTYRWNFLHTEQDAHNRNCNPCYADYNIVPEDMKFESNTQIIGNGSRRYYVVPRDVSKPINMDPSDPLTYNPIDVPLIDNCKLREAAWINYFWGQMSGFPPGSDYAIRRCCFHSDGGGIGGEVKNCYPDKYNGVTGSCDIDTDYNLYAGELYINATSLNKCLLDRTVNPSFGPELRQHGWCEACTYSTLAVQKISNVGEYCPGFKVLYDENNDIQAVKRYGYLDQVGQCRVEGEERSAICYNDLGEYFNNACIRTGWWPYIDPSYYYLKEKIDPYLKSGVMPILDDGAGSVHYDAITSKWIATQPQFGDSGAIIHVMASDSEAGDATIINWNGFNGAMREYYRNKAYAIKKACPQCLIAITTDGNDLANIRSFFGPIQLNPYEEPANDPHADAVDVILAKWTYPQYASETPEQSLHNRTEYGRALLFEFKKPVIFWNWTLGVNAEDNKKLIGLVFTEQRDLTNAGVLGAVLQGVTDSGGNYNLQGQPYFCALHANSSKVLGVTDKTLFTKVAGSPDKCHCEKCTLQELSRGLCGRQALLTLSGVECSRPEDVPVLGWNAALKLSYKAPRNCFEAASCRMCSTMPAATSATCRIETADSLYRQAFVVHLLDENNREIIASLPPAMRCCLNSTDAQNNTVNYTYVPTSGRMRNNELDIYPTRGEEGMECGKTPDLRPQSCGITMPVADMKIECW